MLRKFFYLTALLTVSFLSQASAKKKKYEGLFLKEETRAAYELALKDIPGKDIKNGFVPLSLY
ncbi:MAG: hypothetical protein HRU19_22225 [Pseudobacteriovorax sp.]|nr:hypothetical protein [Pseudobacteriovorax sp.]